MDQLRNKTAIITGGNSGIGYATAVEFLAKGAKVLITGRNPGCGATGRTRTRVSGGRNNSRPI